MFVMLLLMAFASMIDRLNIDYPLWAWAIAYTVCCVLLHLLLGGGLALVPLFMISIMMVLYAWGYFKLLAYLKGQTVMWLCAYAIGAMIPIFLGI